MRRLTSSKLAERSPLQQFAWANRRGPTWSEAKLWAELRGKRLGVSFRRQAVVGPFIVDFLAPSAKLVVEVDGGYHAKRRKADGRRDVRLNELGYRVLRIDAEVAARHIDVALNMILAALGG